MSEISSCQQNLFLRYIFSMQKKKKNDKMIREVLFAGQEPMGTELLATPEIGEICSNHPVNSLFSCDAIIFQN